MKKKIVVNFDSCYMFNWETYEDDAKFWGQKDLDEVSISLHFLRVSIQ